MNISAVVVTYNEERRLSECLQGLSFCEDVTVVDLGSQDDSTQIASRFGASVVVHEWVPTIEMIRSKLIQFAQNDWIIMIDPDEVFDSRIYAEIIKHQQILDQSAIICIPTKYYFLGNELKTTIWGQKHLRKQFIFHRKRVYFSSDVHGGASTLNGFQMWNIPLHDGLHIKHYWIDSIAQLFEKHRRYIEREGEARYNQGQRYNLLHCITHVIRVLRQNLITLKGVFGGWRGIFLSFFHGWYEMQSLLSLKKHEKKKIKNENIRIN